MLLLNEVLFFLRITVNLSLHSGNCAIIVRSGLNRKGVKFDLFYPDQYAFLISMQSKLLSQCNGIALFSTFFAGALNHEVHFGGNKPGRQYNIGDFMIGEAKSFFAGAAVKMYMQVVMLVRAAFFSAQSIFRGTGPIFDNMNQSLLFKGL